MAEQEWYAEGLRFDCTQCGNCCTGPEGAVWFSEEEGQAMAKAVGLEHETFLRRHARKLKRGWSLKEHKTEHGFDCVFLDRDTMPGKAICSLYDARPQQCRTWPFWKENLETPQAWESVKKATPCPGMGKGSLVSIESIRIQRDALP